jgi:hypothetical protein
METLEMPFMLTLPKRERSKVRQVWDMLSDMCELQREAGPVLPIGIVADALGLTNQRVRDIIRDGRLRTVFMDGRHYVTEASLKDFARVERKSGRPLSVDQDSIDSMHTMQAVRRVFPKK